jgi:NADPH:quinone reductase-like Zn-dependent oxidoreductase
MSPDIPKTMRAAVIDKFGGPDVLHVTRIPVPEPGEREILVRVHAAGVGSWDPWVREGGMGGTRFPQVLGSDGSGTVVAAGSKARRFNIGDRVYAYTFDNPKGGFYAEYAAVPEKAAGLVPAGLSLDEAGGLAACGLTAIAGLDLLKMKKALAVLVLGASGGVGHIALQLVKRRGGRILAVASGRDGVALAERLGSDRAVNGKAAGVAQAARDFAPGGFEAALVFANSERLADLLKLVKKGGTIAYPEGVEPEPEGPAGVKIRTFNGSSDPGTFDRLNGLAAQGPFRVEVSRTYRLEDLPRAHRDVLKHHLGKLIVKPRA